MKKRILTFLLAIVMIMSVVPATVLTANAASSLATSDKAINVLKEFEGFEKYAYQSGSKYYIGYGTALDTGNEYPNGITKEDATAELKAHLTDKVDPAINKFTKSYNLNLTQNQHDALALFSYSYGTEWLENSKNALHEAVRTGKSGNEFINLFAQYYGSSPAGESFNGLINRRLAEANMYLNNSYGYNKPANFTYVILDVDGDKVVESTDKVIAYNSSSVQTLARIPTAAESGCDPDSFLGWYVLDKAENKLTGEAVTKLNSDVAGAVLVAKFNETASYTINTNTLPSLNVFNKTYSKSDLQYKDKMDEEAKGTLRANTKFEVDTEKMVEGVKWLRGVGTGSNGKRLEGWVYLGELPEADKVDGKPIETATVNASVLNIRAGATENSTDLGDITKGITVDVYEIKIEKTETGNKRWGKINYNGTIGWINLAYTTENAVSGGTDSADGRTGTIINTDEVNVRNAAGTTGTKVITTLKAGTKVKILNTVNNNGKMWANVEWTGLKDGYTKGWVYMYYIEAEGLEHSNPDQPSGEVLYTGVVTSNINLNVRNNANIYATKVDSLPTGTKVNVYETKTNGGMKWGKIGTNRWVCLSYVKLTAVNNGGFGTVTPGEPEIQGTVTASTLSILKNYNSNAAAVGTLKKGDMVVILEKNTESTETGSRIWGRVNVDGVEGWINLAYVNLKTVTTVAPGTSSGNNAESTNGIIANCLSVNVRDGAGVRNNAITKLKNGTAVVIKERTTVDDASWGRITWNNGASEGWVALMYVNANVSGTTGSIGTTEGGLINGTSSNAISATGYVKHTYVNVRSGAGLGYAQIGTLNMNTKVTIFEQAVADGMVWGRIQYNNTPAWICMSYVTVESASSTGKGVMGTVARCNFAANVRSAPGTGNALIGTVQVGSRVEVFETRQHGEKLWGRIAQGWVCMDYIMLDSELPPGTALDATVPTTEATQPSTEADKNINTNGELAFDIEAQILQDLNVRNDANANSVRVGTINAGMLVDIKAVKNNGAELWGRIDQYATAGWINLDKQYAQYIFTRYVAADDQPIYVDASTSSEVKGTLGINTYLIINKVTTDGTNVYGWVEEGIFGWIPMNKTSDKAVDVIRTYKSGETVGDVKNALFTGTTFNSLDAYDSIGGSRILFKATSGVTVAVDRVRFENGRVWGYVTYGIEGQDSGEYGYAWIDMSKVNYSVPATLTTEMNVRSSMDNSTTKNDDPNNIVTTLPAGTNIQICQLAFDANGNIWARLNGNFALDNERDTNGAFIMVRAFNGTLYMDSVVTSAPAV